MPVEAKLRRPIEADWSFQVLDMDRRLTAFQDRSYGAPSSWRWEFGDGQTSTEQHPVHRYGKEGNYVVTLEVQGPGGKDRRTKVWDVVMR